MSQLQDQINKASKGGILELQYGKEFFERIVIKKPITIRSTSTPATVVEGSPTVKIQSKNVILSDLIIVCNEKDGTCISVKKNTNPVFKNIFVVGNVEGLEGEEGKWELPNALDLSIVPDKINRKKIIILCPVDARIYPSDIANVNCVPEDLNAGINEIDIILDEISERMLVSGNLTIETLGYKIKRRIPISGNTFAKEHGVDSLAEECIWICESGKSEINAESFKNLVKGTQGEPYEYILDVDKINCKEYEISVSYLPDGLILKKDTSMTYIGGTPKVFGEFDIEFVFEKDGQKHSYPSKLNIEEKVILPLKIVALKDPIRKIQGEMITLHIEVLSSNSPNIKFKTKKSLPASLQLNEKTGELWGKVENHGKYTSTIEISDGTNVIQQQLNLIVVPKEPLTLIAKEVYKVYQKEKYEIQIAVQDAERLSPKIKIINQTDNKVIIEKSKGQFLLKGEYEKIGRYEIVIEISDAFQRRAEKKIIIECVKRPSYTFNWISTSPIVIEGLQQRHFSERIEVEIRDENRKKILHGVKYSLVNVPPQKFKLSEDGWLSGVIDGNSYTLKVRAEIGQSKSEEDFDVKTDIKSSSRIVRGGQVPNGVFNYSSKKSGIADKTNAQIKAALEIGCVNEAYKESIFADQSKIPPNFSPTLSNLPQGLVYNSKKGIIEGVPINGGVFNITVNNIATRETWKVNLKIENPIFRQKMKTKREESTKKEGKKGVNLGKAFK